MDLSAYLTTLPVYAFTAPTADMAVISSSSSMSPTPSSCPAIPLASLAQGAEACVYTCRVADLPCVCKLRLPRAYRHPTLDERLTRERWTTEVKSMLRVSKAGVRVPCLYAALKSASPRIYMECVDGVTLRDLIEAHGVEQHVRSRIGVEVGSSIARMHAVGVVHGDLTTSNVIIPRLRGAPPTPLPDTLHACLCGCGSVWVCDPVLIDLGLSSCAASVEDCAVDLYVLARACGAAHSTRGGEHMFEAILASYLACCDRVGLDRAALQRRYAAVSARGRKRLAFG